MKHAECWRDESNNLGRLHSLEVVTKLLSPMCAAIHHSLGGPDNNVSNSDVRTASSTRSQTLEDDSALMLSSQPSRVG